MPGGLLGSPGGAGRRETPCPLRSPHVREMEQQGGVPKFPGAVSPTSVGTCSFLNAHQAARFWLVHFSGCLLHFNKVFETSQLLGEGD